jgi:hypothetical protein
VEPTQLIFGGKSQKCHPNKGASQPPAGLYYTHTDSHWQTPATFSEYVTKVLVPYRLATITMLGLTSSQKMIFVLDLHYSHKDPAVLAQLAANNIIVIFTSRLH